MWLHWWPGSSVGVNWPIRDHLTVDVVSVTTLVTTVHIQVKITYIVRLMGKDSMNPPILDNPEWLPANFVPVQTIIKVKVLINS